MKCTDTFCILAIFYPQMIIYHIIQNRQGYNEPQIRSSDQNDQVLICLHSLGHTKNRPNYV